MLLAKASVLSFVLHGSTNFCGIQIRREGLQPLTALILDLNLEWEGHTSLAFLAA